MVKIKTILLSLLVIFFGQQVNSQKFTISIEKPTPIAYIGLDNPLSCTVEKEPCDSVFLTVDNGSITKVGCNYYMYRPTKVADSKITVVVKRNNQTNVIGSMGVRAREIPDPTPVIGGLSGGLINKKYLLAQMGVASYITPSLGIEIKSMVTQFQITIIRSDSALFTVENTGAIFSKKIKQGFEMLKKDDKVLVTSIYIKKADGRIVLVKPFELVIED